MQTGTYEETKEKREVKHYYQWEGVDKRFFTEVELKEEPGTYKKVMVRYKGLLVRRVDPACTWGSALYKVSVVRRKGLTHYSVSGSVDVVVSHWEGGGKKVTDKFAKVANMTFDELEQWLWGMVGKDQAAFALHFLLN